MVLVSQRPELLQTAVNFRNQCGAYQLRAVLNARGKDALSEELYFAPFMRRRDISLPWLFPAILRRYGVRASCRTWFQRSFKSHLIEVLKSDRPVLFVIRSIRTNDGLHWISAWGYDDATDEFLVYDSQSPPAGNSPAGNTRYKTAELLSALPYRGTFAVIIEK